MVTFSFDGAGESVGAVEALATAAADADADAAALGAEVGAGVDDPDEQPTRIALIATETRAPLAVLFKVGFRLWLQCWRDSRAGTINRGRTWRAR